MSQEEIDVVPRLLGNAFTIIATRCSINAKEMSNKLEEYVRARSLKSVNFAKHEQIYIVRHNGAYKRAMKKFVSIHTLEHMLTLIDENGPLIPFQSGHYELYPLNDYTLANEKFGVMKIKLGLNIVNETAATNIFTKYAKHVKCSASLIIENPNANPVNHSYVGDIYVRMANGRRRSIQEMLIETGAAVGKYC